MAQQGRRRSEVHGAFQVHHDGPRLPALLCCPPPHGLPPALMTMMVARSAHERGW